MSLDDARRIRRRFLILSASRWFPVGLMIPVLTVLLQERGLSLATIGLLSGLSSAVVVLLELPTGGLADTIGRRPVLLIAGFLSLASMSLVSFAEATWLFVLAWAIEGVYRALDSGPLESWYVDAAQAADPDADIESGLAAESAVISGAIAVGALLGGVLALVPTPDSWPPLALPVVVAIALRVVDIVILWRLLDENRPALGGARAALRSARDSGRTIREALTLLRVSGALCALAAMELLWGAGMTGVELLSGLRMVDLVDDANRRCRGLRGHDRGGLVDQRTRRRRRALGRPVHRVVGARGNRHPRRPGRRVWPWPSSSPARSAWCSGTSASTWCTAPRTSRTTGWCTATPRPRTGRRWSASTA